MGLLSGTPSLVCTTQEAQWFRQTRVSGLKHVHYFPNSKLLRSELPMTIK